MNYAEVICAMFHRARKGGTVPEKIEASSSDEVWLIAPLNGLETAWLLYMTKTGHGIIQSSSLYVTDSESVVRNVCGMGEAFAAHFLFEVHSDIKLSAGTCGKGSETIRLRYGAVSHMFDPTTPEADKILDIHLFLSGALLKAKPQTLDIPQDDEEPSP